VIARDLVIGRSQPCRLTADLCGWARVRKFGDRKNPHHWLIRMILTRKIGEERRKRFTANQHGWYGSENRVVMDCAIARNGWNWRWNRHGCM